jgi:hypothetical protein
MNRIRHIRRLASLLAGLAATLLALTASATAAFAAPRMLPGPGGASGSPDPSSVHTPVAQSGVLSRLVGPAQTLRTPHPAAPAHIHAAVTGGMPGWQITLIAIGAALAAAILAVLADRVLTTRRRATPTPA